MLVGFSFLLSLATQSRNLLLDHSGHLLQNSVLSQAGNKNTPDHCVAHVNNQSHYCYYICWKKSRTEFLTLLVKNTKLWPKQKMPLMNDEQF